MTKSIIRSAVTLVLLSLSVFAYASNPAPAPQSLRVGEGFKDPIGFYQAEPIFSWKLPVDKRVKLQSAYEIVAATDTSLLPDRADLWSSRKVESDRSVWIEYGGLPLKSRQKVYWQIRYWDQDGQASAWSSVAQFELGLLDNSDWEGQWIGYPFEGERETTKFGTKIYPAQYIRKELEVSSEIVSARLYITAKGVFEAEINGRKVGEAIMAPGYTPYQKRIETLTYDVTDMLNSGHNAIGISLAPGWNTTRIGWTDKQYVEKAPPKVICQLEIELQDGSRQKYLSDGSWRATDRGPIRFAEIYDGEVYDQRLELGDWSKVGYADDQWKPVIVLPIEPEVKLQPKRHYSVVNKQELPALEITRAESGAFIFDFGQNMVGVPRIKVPMQRGDTLIVRFAEMLQDNGELYTENYREAHSTDYYIAAKDGMIEYTPKFTFHGFRYVELAGIAPKSNPERLWVTGIVQYSDFGRAGSFISSHSKLNQLQNNIEWGLRGNFFDIPTDCPQRDERMGWTGDAQIFAPTAYFLADVHSFFSSWMQSVREEQLTTGIIPIVVPNVAKDRVSPGWSDAITVIPWEAYMRTGDESMLRDNFPAMRKWIAYYLTQRKNGIIDMKGFGDWLQPFSANGNYGETPRDLIATAYCAYSVRLAKQTADVLGYAEDSKELSMLYDDLRSSFETHFFDATGKITSVETQTGYLMALGFDLLSDGQVAEGAKANLEKLIEQADRHLRTGFLGTPLLAPVLDKIDRSDLAYAVVFKESYPSWFYSIDQGATTMWERWNSYSTADGFGDAGMNSFNHYAYGAVGQWMYERMTGISPILPGYKKIRIAPYPNHPLTSAKGQHESPYGNIVSEWEIAGNKILMRVVVPPNTTALIVIPNGGSTDVQINGMKLKSLKTIQQTRRTKETLSFEVPAGEYDIVSTLN